MLFAWEILCRAATHGARARFNHISSRCKKGREREGERERDDSVDAAECRVQSPVCYLSARQSVTELLLTGADGRRAREGMRKREGFHSGDTCQI